MSDYVIKRRRRSLGFLAVDPCLGYYVHKSVPARQEGTLIQSADVLDAYIHSRADDINRDESVVPSSIPGEVELELCLLEQATGSRIDQEADERPSDWIEVISGRSKRSCHSRPTFSQQQPLSAQPAYHGSELLPDSQTSLLTVEGFLRASVRKNRKPEKKYRTIKSSSRTKTPNYKNTPATARRSSSKTSPACIHEADNTLSLRSRAISRVLPATDELTSSGARSASLECGASTISTCSQSLQSSVIKKQRRKYSKSLKQRIFEACVATHGNPEDEYAQDEVDPSRPPLRFVPGLHGGPDTSPRSSAHTKRKWDLVDPRKTQAIRTASFSSKIQRVPRVLANDDSSALRTHDLDRLGIDNWIWDADAPSRIMGAKTKPHPQKKGGSQVDRADLKAADYPALQLLPLTPGQRSPDYQSLFRKKRGALVAVPPVKSKRRKKEPMSSNSNPLPLDVAMMHTGENSGECISTQKGGRYYARAPLNLVRLEEAKMVITDSQLELPGRGKEKQGTSRPSPHYSNDLSTPSASTSFARASDNAGSMTVRYNIRSDNESITSPIRGPSSGYQPPSAQSNHLVASRDSMSSRWDTSDHASLEPAKTEALLSAKPLRSLESFMDEFFTTARTVSAQSQIRAEVHLDDASRRSMMAQKAQAFSQRNYVSWEIGNELRR